jgi:hypothetical protein
MQYKRVVDRYCKECEKKIDDENREVPLTNRELM